MSEANAANNNTANPENNPFEISRVFNAPRELIFKVWSEVEHLKNWWGPAGLEWIHAKMDFRPGGLFVYCMRSPEGFELWGRFEYREIEAPEKVVFVNSFSNPEGGIARAPFSPIFPLEVLNVITFTENEGRTTVTLKGGPINATGEEMNFFKGMFDSMRQGFGGTFDQLEAYLAKL